MIFLIVFLMATANMSMAAIDTGGGTNPVTLSFILIVGLINGLVVFFIGRQIMLYFYQRGVILHRKSPKDSLQKYWGRFYFTVIILVSLFSCLFICGLLMWIFERDVI